MSTYPRTLVTRVGVLELKVPRVIGMGGFPENYSSATCAAERHWCRPWRRCTYRACPTLKVKAITEELCGHGFSASTVSNINQRLDESLAQFAQHPWWTHVIAPTLAHLGRPDCRYAAPRSRPSAGCCTEGQPRGTCRRRRPESHASSRHSAPGRSRGPGCHRLGTGGTLVRRRREWVAVRLATPRQVYPNLQVTLHRLIRRRPLRPPGLIDCR